MADLRRELIRAFAERDLRVGSHAHLPRVMLALRPGDVVGTDSDHGRVEAQFLAASRQGLPNGAKGPLELQSEAKLAMPK